MNLKSHIGIRLKSARRRAGLTQEALAEAVDKAVETISNIERGHSLTGVDTLEQIASAVGTPISYFFEDFPHKRKITTRRAQLQQQLLDAVEKLPDDQIRIALKLVKALNPSSVD
jgi:transcriptional regulator with XRE-family HTH domain